MRERARVGADLVPPRAAAASSARERMCEKRAIEKSERKDLVPRGRGGVERADQVPRRGVPDLDRAVVRACTHTLTLSLTHTHTQRKKS